MSKSPVYIITITTFLLLLLSCNNTVKPIARQDMAMDTVISITLYQPSSEAVFDQIFARMHDIDWKMSAQKAESEINAVNNKAGIAPVHVSADTLVVMKRALHMAELSGGVFDPSIGPIVRLWDIAGEHPHVATEAEIAAVLPLVNWHNIVINDADGTIYLNQKGMRLDFGGIAKGYAADEAARLTRASGTKAGVLSMGDSSIHLLGTKPDGKKWRVGVQDPFAFSAGAVERGKLLGIIECVDSTVETSGPYERFFMSENKRYHHIMDPRTGAPVENDIEQVTLILPNTTDLPDGLSTSCYIKGLKDGMQLVESLPGVAGLFITHDKKIYASSRVGDRFTLDDPNLTIIPYKAE